MHCSSYTAFHYLPQLPKNLTLPPQSTDVITSSTKLSTISPQKNRICGSVRKTKQKKTPKQQQQKNISSHPTYVRRLTFRSQGSKALRAYNQYYIFHCHLHSYCKWLVSKTITGCIRNLGFAISLLVLGGPPSPSPAAAALGVNDATVADTSHTTVDSPTTPPPTPFCPFFISLLLTAL